MDQTDAERIRDALSDTAATQVDLIEAFSKIESTNSYLIEQPAPQPGFWRVAVADRQTAGRGRFDKHWESPASSGLYLSAARTFARMPNFFSCLTLSIGVGVIEALRHMGVGQAKLKWPNDLILNDGKLGGILTEVQPGSGASVTVVIGVGINVLSEGKLDSTASTIGRIAELSEVMQDLPATPLLAATVLESMIDVAAHFEVEGFDRYRQRWPRYDWLLGKSIVVDAPAARHYGTAMGIDKDGALLVNKGAEMQRVISGSVSLLEERHDND